MQFVIHIIQELYKQNGSSGIGDYCGGIVGYIEGYSIVEKCYNKGNVKGEKNRNGGIAGGSIARKYASNGISSWVIDEKAKNEINYTCNIENVNSSGAEIGGICGFNGKYCLVKNNAILKGIEIKSGTVSASNDVGESSNNYIGKYVGLTQSSGKDFIDGNARISNDTEDVTDTVYYIVNGKNDAESKYWSKGNPTEPKLKWESNEK